jgi:hypothetical protein
VRARTKPLFAHVHTQRRRAFSAVCKRRSCDLGGKETTSSYVSEHEHQRPSAIERAIWPASFAVRQSSLLECYGDSARNGASLRPAANFKRCACFCFRRRESGARPPAPDRGLLTESIDWLSPVVYLSASCCNPHSRLLDWRPDAILVRPRLLEARFGSTPGSENPQPLTRVREALCSPLVFGENPPAAAYPSVGRPNAYQLDRSPTTANLIELSDRVKL